MTQILLYGSGDFPLFFRALIEIAREQGAPLDWSIILPTYHHVEMMTELLGPDRVLHLQPRLSQLLAAGIECSALSTYDGSLYKDIEADKAFIKARPGQRQVANGAGTYLVYRDFLKRIRPDLVLYALCETHDGVILASAARELGIATAFTTHTRNLGETFFAPDQYESLPPYAAATEPSRRKAEAFLADFQSRYIPAGNFARSDGGDSDRFPVPTPGRISRTAAYLRDIWQDPEQRSFSEFEVRFLNNLPVYRDVYRWAIARANGRQFDIDRMEDLPRRFIYYPLQYTPESSINVPAPYFLDQRRAIDQIRFSMPSDMTLVVKEHPACLPVRPRGFIKSLRRCAGVVVARYSMDSRELIRRAELTISVTGTATLEAFLLGRPSLVLGSSFFAEFLGGPAEFSQLGRRIRSAIANPPTRQAAVAAIARVFSATWPVILRSPTGEPHGVTMARRNVQIYLDALQEHLRRAHGGV